MKGFLYEDNVNSLVFTAKTLRDLDLDERLVQLESLVNKIAQRLPEYWHRYLNPKEDDALP
jgi:hypothetical protein